MGGISSPHDAFEKIKAGATLLQAYSGFVFEGPALSKSVIHGLKHSLDKNHYSSLQSAVGADEQPK